MSEQLKYLKYIDKKLHSHPFVPPKFLQSPHIQTALAGVIPYFKTPMKKPERLIIEIPEDSKMVANCWFQKDKKDHATVVFLNGFEGYSGVGKSNFAKNMSMKAFHFGFNAIYLKQRGEADTMHLTKSIFTTYSGLFDIKIAINTFVNLGLSNIYLVGLSYGGYLLFHMIERLDEQEREHIRGVVTLSAPTETFGVWNHLERNKFYDKWLLRSYKHIMKRRAKIDLWGKEDYKKLQNIKTKRQFMETYMHTFGYPKKSFTWDEYVKATDVTSAFSNNTVPLLLISSYDDPIIPIERYLQSDIVDNPYIITLLPKYGGHGGFFSFKKRYGDLDAHWAQNRVIEFIRLLEER